MKIKIILLLFLFFTNSSFSQETFFFTPKWKVGDVKKMVYTSTRKDYTEGKLDSEKVETREVVVNIISENEMEYVVAFLYENIALKSTTDLYEKLDEELKDYKDLKLIYTINKQTAKADLINWEEARAFINGSFDKIIEVLETINPEDTTSAKLMLKPVLDMFKSKADIESYVSDDIINISIPFNQEFELNKTVTHIDSSANPFNPNEQISMTTNLTLTSLDKQNSTCVFDMSIIFDLTEFKNMIKEMMTKMSESFGVKKKTIKKKRKELDDFEFDMTNNQTFLFDYKSTWVTEINKSVIVLGNDPKNGKRRNEVFVKIVIKEGLDRL